MPADIPDLARTHVAAWRESYSGLLPAGFLARLSEDWRARWWTSLLAGGEGPALALAAVDGEGAVGGLAVFAPAIEAPPGWDHEIRALYLLRRWHGRGLGRAMLEQGRDWVRARGGRNLMAWVIAGNETAARFYRASGAVDLPMRHVRFGELEIEEIGFGWERV